MNYEYQPPMMPMAMPMSKEENLYPEVYKKMHPHVVIIVQELEAKNGNVYLTEELLNQMSDELIKRSGMKMSDDPMEAVPTVAPYYPYGGRGYWGYHNHDSLRDFGRILFLSEIFGRGRRWRWHY